MVNKNLLLVWVLIIGVVLISGCISEGWEEVGSGSATGGGISNNNRISWYSSIAIAPDGTPYVAWADRSGGDAEIYVRRWNGNAWEEVGAGSATGGGISDDERPSLTPSIAIAPDGTPYVAWDDVNRVATWTNRYEESGEIYVRRWNGNAWEEVGAGSATGGGISNTIPRDSRTPSIAIAPDGTPYIAWADKCRVDSYIYIRRWNGSNWEEVGSGSATGRGISKNTYDSEYPSIAIAPDGTPYVAWQEQEDYHIYILRWDGSMWEEVGPGSASDGGISGNRSYSWMPSIAIAQDGTPYVAWEEDGKIYVRLWNGNAWEEVGAGSATGRGISKNTYDSEYPSIAIAPDGTPYVAWADRNGGDAEIYVRRWNGNAWEEVGAGSATGGGISNSRGNSMYPFIAVAPDGKPYVVWGEQGSEDEDTEIYIRRRVGQ